MAATISGIGRSPSPSGTNTSPRMASGKSTSWLTMARPRSSRASLRWKWLIRGHVAANSTGSRPPDATCAVSKHHPTELPSSTVVMSSAVLDQRARRGGAAPGAARARRAPRRSPRTWRRPAASRRGRDAPRRPDRPASGTVIITSAPSRASRSAMCRADASSVVGDGRLVHDDRLRAGDRPQTVTIEQGPGLAGVGGQEAGHADLAGREPEVGHLARGRDRWRGRRPSAHRPRRPTRWGWSPVAHEGSSRVSMAHGHHRCSHAPVHLGARRRPGHPPRRVRLALRRRGRRVADLRPPARRDGRPPRRGPHLRGRHAPPGVADVRRHHRHDGRPGRPGHRGAGRSRRRGLGRRRRRWCCPAGWR